jgi:hypothetical protein
LPEQTIPKEGRYMDKEKAALDLEWERRTLCSDGSCIGVIGPDGRCKECSKPYEGELPDVEVQEASASNEIEDSISGDMTEDTVSEDTDNLDEEWENRRLCSDGNCIGVIGPDERCKECGKPFEG